MRIAHIINPVKVDESRDLHWQQPIVFDCLYEARRYASSHGILIEPVATFYPEDEEMCVGFMKTEPLERSVLDIQEFGISKKLPFFKDIIQNLYDTSTADYFVYTNADICVMPHFYLFIKDMIEKGHDSFVINKRIIPEELKDEGLPMMWSNLGTAHADYRIHCTNEFTRILKKLYKRSKRILKHPEIEYMLKKLNYEVAAYSNETYSKDCHYFVNKK